MIGVCGVKKRMCSLLILMIAHSCVSYGITGNSGGANQGVGYYLTQASYELSGHQLKVEGYFVNSTSRNILGVKTMRLTLNGRDGFVVAKSIAENRLSHLEIGSGMIRRYSFVVDRPNQGKDLSRLDYNIDCDFIYGDSVRYPEGIKVFYKGEMLKYDVPPTVIDGRIVIPARGTFEKMGARVDWDEGLQTATITRGDKTIQVKVNSTQMRLNGRNVTLDVPARIIANRTLLPLRAVASAMDCTINWGNTDEIAVIHDDYWD